MSLWSSCIPKWFRETQRFKFKRALSNYIFTCKAENKCIIPSNCLQLHCPISTMPSLCAVHTTKNWKLMARDGESRKKKDNISFACEDGNEAVPHSVVHSELQKCASIISQMEKFSSLVSLSLEDIEKRRAFVKSFHEPFQIYFPKFRVFQFGSGINGLGFKGCDSDICLQTTFNNEEFILQKEVPTLDSVQEGVVSREEVARLTPLYMMRFVRRILREHCPDVKEPILLVKARCPILRFYDSKYNLFVDFSCESGTSVRNTKLLRFMCHLDERFAPLAKVIKYWGKYGGFVGDIDMFNSYSFVLLVVHFLQSTTPPVLPSIQEIVSKSEYLKNGDVEEYDKLYDDLKNFPQSKNTQPIEDLLRGFFFYFANYDYSRIMQPFLSSTIPTSEFVSIKDPEDKFEFGAVNIQDPFRHAFNATFAASFKTCKRFLNGLIQACEVYQNPDLMVPKTETFGLCSIFQPAVSEQEMYKNLQENHCHTIKLPMVPDAVAKLKQIFKHALLFHVTEFKMLNNMNQDSGSRSLVKLRCIAKTKTWLGRDTIVKKYDFKQTDLIELEHLVSLELSNKTSIEFSCECTEVEENGNSMFVITINFKDSKVPPNVIIFLKEYIPCILTKL